MTRATRDEAIATLEEGHGTMIELFDRLADEQAEASRTIGGGDWSAKDLMGHLAFWEELAIEAVGAWRGGTVPRAESIFNSNDVDAVNADNDEQTAKQSMLEVRQRARTSHDAIVALIRELGDDEWESGPPYPTERRRHLVELLGSILGAPKRPFGHAFAHESDLRAAVEKAAG